MTFHNPLMPALLAPKPEITPAVAKLLHMLSYRRAGGSATERQFIAKFIAPHKPQEDDYGNLWIKVGEAPEILWSCHTDTVAHGGGRQRLFLRGSLVFAQSSDCLGADDTAGCWLALEMIEAGVPGLYIFHRDEESGGGGSSWIAKHRSADLAGIKFAVALDRKGYTSVITHQFGRCCSDAFAKSMAAILGGDYAPDETGLFTDTANYTDIIGECSNLSVGYHDAHGGNESLDIAFIVALRDKLISADFSTLVSEREPGDWDANDYGGMYESGGGRSYGHHHHGGYEPLHGHHGGFSGYQRKSHGGSTITITRMDLFEMVRAYPLAVADMLEQWGFDAAGLAEELKMATGQDVDADEYEDTDA